MAPWRRIGLHTIISNKTTELPLGRSVVSLLRSHLQSEQIINSESVKKSENIFVKAKLFCPEIAGLFCRIAGLFCHDSRANLSLKPVCFGIAIS